MMNEKSIATKKKTVYAQDIAAELYGMSDTATILCNVLAPNADPQISKIVIHQSLFELAQHLRRIAEDIDECEIA